MNSTTDMIAYILSIVGVNLDASATSIISLLIYLGLLVAGVVFVFATKSLKTKTDDFGRTFFLGLLETTGRITDHLKSAIRYTLGIFDRIFGDHYFEKQADNVSWKSLNPLHDSSPFTFKSFRSCVTIAICYPLVLLFLVYLFSGEGHFSIWALSESGLSLTEKIGAALSAIAAFFLGRLLRKTMDRETLSETTKDFLITIAVAVAFGVAVAGAFAGAFVAFVAFAGPFTDTFDVAFAFAFAVAFGVAGAVAGAFGVALGVTFSVAFAVAGPFAVAFVFVFVFVFAFAVAFVILVTSLLNRHIDLLPQRWGVFIYIGAGSMVIIAPLIFLQLDIVPEGLSIASRVFLMMLTPFLIIPCVNAVFDWVSLGMTRLLLAAHLKLDSRPQRVLLILLDFILACLLVPLLLAFLIITIHILSDFSVDHQINPGDIKSSLAEGTLGIADYIERNAKYLWVFGMLITTLVPTLIHFFFAALTIATYLLYLFPYFGGKIEKLVSIKERQMKNSPNATPIEMDTMLTWWIPGFIAGVSCLVIWVFIPLYIFFDSGITWLLYKYGQLLLFVADLMI